MDRPGSGVEYPGSNQVGHPDAVTMRRVPADRNQARAWRRSDQIPVMSMEPVIMEGGVVEELHGTVQDITALRELEFQMPLAED